MGQCFILTRCWFIINVISAPKLETPAVCLSGQTRANVSAQLCYCLTFKKHFFLSECVKKPGVNPNNNNKKIMACKEILNSKQQFPPFLVSPKAQPVTWHPVWRNDRLKVTLSPTPRGPACTPSSLSPLGPCCLPSGTLNPPPPKKECTATVSLPTVSVWEEKEAGSNRASAALMWLWLTSLHCVGTDN